MTFERAKFKSSELCARFNELHLPTCIANDFGGEWEKFFTGRSVMIVRDLDADHVDIEFLPVK